MMKHTRKTLRRFAASFLAVMLLAALAIVPAGAVDMGESGVATPSDGDQTVTISQTITVSDPNASVPPAVFTYTLTGNSATVGADEALPVYTGITAGITTPITVEFGDDDAIDDTTRTVTDTFNIDFSGVVWTGVGVYRYTLTYTCDNKAVVCPMNDTLYLDVYVINDGNGDYEVEFFVLSKDATLNYDADDGSYTYTGKTDGFDAATYETYSITVKKYITGTMANLSDTFDFSVDFTNLPEGVTVDVDKEELATVKEDGSVTGTLGDTEYFTISGIPAMDKAGNPVTYVVEETDAGSGYTTTYEVDTALESWQGTGAVTGTATSTLTVSEDTIVEFNNNREAVSPTGIITTFAPYALMVVVAAAACFFFLRRRNAAED